VPEASQLNAKSKIQEEAHFQILRLLHENPELTRRQLGERVGISLGAVNYCLESLIDRGFVKARNFKRSLKKIGYVYFLTPAGIAEESPLTARFLNLKVNEYEVLKKEIRDLSAELGNRHAEHGDSV